MSRLDAMIDRGADRLQELANRASSNGGRDGWLARELADDAAFLRRLKPSLIKARARGEAPTNGRPQAPVVAPEPLRAKPPERPRERSGRSPFLVIGVAFAAGVLLARVIEWKSLA